jgi:hypothetical protein
MSNMIQMFLWVRNSMKNYHWSTTTYSRHIASDAFVTSIDILIDRFVEVYLGKFPRIVMESGAMVPLLNISDSDIIQILEDFKKFLMGELVQIVTVNNNISGDLINIRDEMVAQANQTLYLFTFK